MYAVEASLSAFAFVKHVADFWYALAASNPGKVPGRSTTSTMPAQCIMHDDLTSFCCLEGIASTSKLVRGIFELVCRCTKEATEEPTRLLHGSFTLQNKIRILTRVGACVVGLAPNPV